MHIETWLLIIYTNLCPIKKHFAIKRGILFTTFIQNNFIRTLRTEEDLDRLVDEVEQIK